MIIKALIPSLLKVLIPSLLLIMGTSKKKNLEQSAEAIKKAPIICLDRVGRQSVLPLSCTLPTGQKVTFTQKESKQLATLQATFTEASTQKSTTISYTKPLILHPAYSIAQFVKASPALQTTLWHEEADYLYIGTKGLRGGHWLSGKIENIKQEMSTHVRNVLLNNQYAAWQNQLNNEAIKLIGNLSVYESLQTRNHSWTTADFWVSRLDELYVDIKKRIKKAIDHINEKVNLRCEGVEPRLKGRIIEGVITREVATIREDMIFEEAKITKIINKAIVQYRISTAIKGGGAKVSIKIAEKLYKNPTLANAVGVAGKHVLQKVVVPATLASITSIASGANSNSNTNQAILSLDHHRQPEVLSAWKPEDFREPILSSPAFNNNNISDHFSENNVIQFENREAGKGLFSSSSKSHSDLSPEVESPKSIVKRKKKVKKKAKKKVKKKAKVDKNLLAKVDTALTGYTGSQIAQAAVKEYGGGDGLEFMAGGVGTGAGRIADNALTHGIFTQESVATDVVAGFGGVAGEKLGGRVGIKIAGKGHEKFGQQVGEMAGSVGGQMITEMIVNKIIEEVCIIM